MLFKKNKARKFIKSNLLDTPKNKVFEDAFNKLTKEEKDEAKVKVVESIVKDATSYKLNNVIIGNEMTGELSTYENGERCLKFCENDKKLADTIEVSIKDIFKKKTDFLYSIDNVNEEFLTQEDCRIAEYLGEKITKASIINSILSSMMNSVDESFETILEELYNGVYKSEDFANHIRSIRGEDRFAITKLELVIMKMSNSMLDGKEIVVSFEELVEELKTLEIISEGYTTEPVVETKDTPVVAETRETPVVTDPVTDPVVETKDTPVVEDPVVETKETPVVTEEPPVVKGSAKNGKKGNK